MPAVRSATVSLLLTLVIHGWAAGSIQRPDSPAQCTSCVIPRANSCLAIFPRAHLPQRPPISPLTPWKGRLKSVLEETNPEFVDEFDLEPVVIPRQLSLTLPIALIADRLALAPRLRC
jgi:hypothetical protein